MHLHLYGKHEPRPRRKMGHLTAVAESVEAAATTRCGRANDCERGDVTTEIEPTGTPNERARAVARAVALLRAGEVVALPTETVYGLAADALSAAAVVKIFETKERPRFDPLIVHLPELSWLEKVAVIEDEAHDPGREVDRRFLARAPDDCLTRARDLVPPIVTAGLETIAIRMSAHPLFSRRWCAPLADRSRRRARIASDASARPRRPMWRRNCRAAFRFIVDGGATEHGIESTVIAVRDGGIEVLRAGPITREELAGFAPRELRQTGRTEAPGQLPSHYRPQTPLVIVRRPFGNPSAK